MDLLTYLLTFFLLIMLVMNMLPNDLIVTVSSTCLFVIALEDVPVAFSTDGLDDIDTDQLKYSVPYRVVIIDKQYIYVFVTSDDSREFY